MLLVAHKFSTLDGLRGLAAISVMAYHRRDWFGGNDFVLGHAALAVDFFFLLSGFVLAHAYEERLKSGGNLGNFIRDRVIRLHPMLVAGAILAMFVAYLDARRGQETLSHPILTLLAHAVPFPVLWGSLPAAFPWNIAIWSLFWELLANLIFAAIAPWLTNRVLGIIVGVSIAIMVFVSISANGFQVGFARDLNQFIWGFPRVCSSFFFGVLLYRFQNFKMLSGRYWGLICACLLLLTFVSVQRLSLSSALFDPIIAYIVYPILLLIAARSQPWMPRVSNFLGAISYPLYIIHEPMLKVLSGMLKAFQISSGPPGGVEAIFRFCTIVGLSYLILRIYDEPTRSLLRRWSNHKRVPE